MKEWIKKLSDKDIMEIETYKHIQIQVPKDVNYQILAKIRGKPYKINEKKTIIAPAKKFLIAATVFVCLCIPVLLLIINLQDSNKLILVQTINKVLFKENNKTLLLSKGDILEINYKIQTDKHSTCIIQYTGKSALTIDEKSEIEITEFNKKRIMFRIDEGKITVEEKIQKGARIEILTPFALVYAIGTLYSVEHNTSKEETIIKAFEGELYIKTIPVGKEYILKAGNEIVIKQDEPPVKREIDYSYKEIKKEWIVKEAYFMPGQSDAVTGFTVSEDIVAAVTEHLVVCLTENGILWEKFLNRTTVTALPVILYDNVYIPTTSGILSFKIQTWEQKPVIELNETTELEFKILSYKNTLYAVLSTGIYICDVNKINDIPIIPVFGAQNPLFYNNTMYTFSYITNTLEAYTLTGNNLWSVSIDDTGYCQPAVINNFIIAGTKSGILYKISKNGEIIKQIKTGEKIVSIKKDDINYIFVRTAENKLLKINYVNFIIEKIFTETSAGVVYNNMLITGTNYGTIKIIYINSGIEREIKLSYNSSVTSFAIFKDIIFAGLENGYILKLENR